MEIEYLYRQPIGFLIRTQQWLIKRKKKRSNKKKSSSFSTSNAYASQTHDHCSKFKLTKKRRSMKIRHNDWFQRTHLWSTRLTKFSFNYQNSKPYTSNCKKTKLPITNKFTQGIQNLTRKKTIQKLSKFITSATPIIRIANTKPNPNLKHRTKSNTQNSITNAQIDTTHIHIRMKMVCVYIPPWMSFVDLEDVPEEKSSRSTSPTRRPRVTASRATPLPVAPPPITRTSSGLTELEPISAASCTALDGTAAFRSLILCRIAESWDPPPRSLADSEGWYRRTAPPDTPATAAAHSRRLRRAVAAIRWVQWERREMGTGERTDSYWNACPLIEKKKKSGNSMNPSRAKWP